MSADVRGSEEDPIVLFLVAFGLSRQLVEHIMDCEITHWSALGLAETERTGIAAQ